MRRGWGSPRGRQGSRGEVRGQAGGGQSRRARGPFRTAPPQPSRVSGLQGTPHLDESHSPARWGKRGQRPQCQSPEPTPGAHSPARGPLTFLLLLPDVLSPLGPLVVGGDQERVTLGAAGEHTPVIATPLTGHPGDRAPSRPSRAAGSEPARGAHSPALQASELGGSGVSGRRIAAQGHRVPRMDVPRGGLMPTSPGPDAEAAAPAEPLGRCVTLTEKSPQGRSEASPQAHGLPDCILALRACEPPTLWRRPWSPRHLPAVGVRVPGHTSFWGRKGTTGNRRGGAWVWLASRAWSVGGAWPTGCDRQVGLRLAVGAWPVGVTGSGGARPVGVTWLSYGRDLWAGRGL